MAEATQILQQGVGDSLPDHYYDIMVIGRTGSGKSTTVDKLLIASLPGQQWQKWHGHRGERHFMEEDEEKEVVHDSGKRALRFSNIMMWLISDKDFAVESTSLRLKNLVYFSSLESPHEAVNTAHAAGMHVYESTTHCELFSNELTRVRVLDVPGFFGSNEAAAMKDLNHCLMGFKEADLSTMRKILRIKTMHTLKFNRIVYFLPEKGSLQRTSGDLIIELNVMKEYFGRPIFESMVVVATLPSLMYKHIKDEGQNLFPESDLEDTREVFRKALQLVFKSKEIPDPPIIFISLFDICEKILDNIKKAGVKHDSLNLEFRNSICARCNAHITHEGIGEAEALSCTNPDQLGAVACEESTCHPLMVPSIL